MIDTIVQVVLLLVCPPLMLGVIIKVKAAFAGRAGAPLLQPYYDLARLWQKGAVLSRTTTWVFIAGPAVTLVAVTLAGLIVPMSGGPAPVRFTGDLILFAYLFALGRFFTAIAALDTGSSFEGMGAARDLTFACLAEPALFFALLALARVTGETSLSGLLGGKLAAAWTTAAPSMVLLLAGLCVVLLAENARIPFDDPNTHLELTMIHEVMVLDHSGPALGAALYGAAIKLFVLSAVVVRVVLPTWPEHAALNWVVFVAAILLIAALIGVVESVMARLRMLHVPNLLIGACLLSGFAFILLLGSPR